MGLTIIPAQEDLTSEVSDGKLDKKVRQKQNMKPNDFEPLERSPAENCFPKRHSILTRDLVITGLLWLASITVAAWGLNSIALVGDEPIVARVALEISNSGQWGIPIQPTLWGAPYLNKPPLLHSLIATSISLWRSLTHSHSNTLPPEWVIRAIPALLSSLIIPITVITQRILLPYNSKAAYFSALVMLSTPPLVTHMHIAMLDGLQLAAIALLWLFLLLAIDEKGNVSHLYCFLSGLCGSLILLIKPPTIIPVSLAGILALLISGKQPLRINVLRICAFAGLGLLPGIAWHLLKFVIDPSGFIHLWWTEGLARPLMERSDAVRSPRDGKYLFNEFLKGGITWIVPFMTGAMFAVKNLNARWSRWSVVALLFMVFMGIAPRPSHPHYSYLIWYPFSLISGFGLYLITNDEKSHQLHRRLTAMCWIFIGFFCLAYITSPTLQAFLPEGMKNYRVVTMILPLPLLAGAFLILKQTIKYRTLGVFAVVIGWIISLILLLGTNHWNPWGGYPENNKIAEQIRNIQLRGGAEAYPIASKRDNYTLAWYLDQKIITDVKPLLTEKFIYILNESSHSRSKSPLIPVGCELETKISKSESQRTSRTESTEIYICRPN